MDRERASGAALQIQSEGDSLARNPPEAAETAERERSDGDALNSLRFRISPLLIPQAENLPFLWKFIKSRCVGGDPGTLARVDLDGGVGGWGVPITPR
jgi:hypothetical protein